jgi:hypothetical protein
VRSDPGVDRLDNAELRRRRESHLGERQAQARLSDDARAAWFGNHGPRELWATHRRLEHEWQDFRGVGWRERTYFLGEGCDDRLMVPLDPSAVPVGADGWCGICWVSLREEVDVKGPPVHLPCGDLHRYHEKCIGRWLTENGSRSCPHCRRQFKIATFDVRYRSSEDFVSFFVNYQRHD